MLKRIVLLSLMLAVSVAAGVYTFQDESLTEVASAADTNRISGTIRVPVVMQDEQRHQTKWDGAFVQVWSSGIHNDSDGAFGNVDTTILNYYSVVKNIRQLIKTDTMAQVPETSFCWIVGDTLANLMDWIEIDYTCSDSTTDYSQTGQITTCSLLVDTRYWRK